MRKKIKQYVSMLMVMLMAISGSNCQGLKTGGKG